MAVDNKRSLLVILQEDDSPKISRHGWQLQVAKSVIKNNKLIFNTIWKSKVLAPTMNISWKPDYAFNWTETVPEDGIEVVCGGNWLKCDVGEVVDINDAGFLVRSNTKADPSYMKIGTNKYKSEAPDGIFIVIGSADGKGGYTPIFTDTVPIAMNMESRYQPQEKLQWWYEVGSNQGIVFTDRNTPVGTGDFSAPDAKTGTFKKTSTYDYANGEWKTEPLPCK